jgi:hypothetical protein
MTSTSEMHVTSWCILDGLLEILEKGSVHTPMHIIINIHY